MIKRFYISLIFLLLFVNMLFASGGELVCKKLDMVSSAIPNFSVKDNEGNIVMAGYKSISLSDESFYLAKFNSDCSGILWSYEENPSSQSDRLVAVTTDFEGNVITVGYILHGNNFDIKVLKLGKDTGNKIWEERYNGSANLDDYPVFVKTDSIGNIYVAGYSRNSSGNDDFLLIKYSKNGGLPLWVRTFNSAYNRDDRITTLNVNSDSVVVAGYSDNGTNLDMLVIKYSILGDLIWSRRYIGDGNNEDRAVVVRFDSNGDVILAGFTINSFGDKDIYVGKYLKNTGVPVWERVYNGGYDEEPYSIFIDVNDNIYLTGYKWTIEHHTQLFTIKFSSFDGSPIWQNSYSVPEDVTTVGTDIIVEEEGDVYVTGYLVRGTNYNIFTIKYHKLSGNQVWAVEYEGDSNKNERPVGIFISLDGKIIVAGWSETDVNAPHFLIIKYDPGSINAPTNLRADVISNTEVRLSWSDNSNNEDSFKIERKTGDLGSWVEIASVSSDIKNYNDKTVSPHTKYYYRVRAYSSAFGYSHYSNEVKVITTVISFEQPTWVYTFNGTGNNDDYANDIAIGPDNNPVITGLSYSSISGFDYFTVKLRRDNGNYIWYRFYDDPENDTDIATCIDVDNNNNVIVSGFASLFNPIVGYNTNDIMTIKYSSTGTVLWSDAYSGPGNNDDRSVAVSIRRDTSSNAYVLGYGKNINGNDDIYLIKYSDSGSRLWSNIYNGGSDDYPSSFVIDKNGDVIVSGYVTRNGHFDWYVTKHRSSDGNVLWRYFYDESGLEDKALSITSDKNGDIFVTGFITKSNGIRDILLIKLSGNDGSVVWQKKMGRTSGGNEAKKVLIDPVDGEVVIAGTITNIEGDKDIYTAKLKNADGTIIWEKNVSRLSINDVLADALMDVSGNICIGGNTGSGEGQDVVAVKFDHEGNILGASLYDGVAHRQDGVEKIALNRYGETFLAGYTTTINGDTDILVFKCGMDIIQVPTPVTATASYNSIVINWTDNSLSELGYRIERKAGSCSSNENFQLVTQTLPNVTTFTDNNLPIDTTFCYRILTLGPNNQTTREDVYVETRTLKPQPPSITSIQSLNTTTVKIDWTDNTTEESGFGIQRCQGVNCENFEFLANVPANTVTYNDTTACNGMIYRYRIYAYKTGYWTTDFSNVLNVTLPQPSSTFSLTLTALSESSVKLDWIDSFNDEVGFVIERCEGVSCNNFSEIATVAANSTTYNDNTVSWSKTYKYRVKAFKNSVCSWYVYSNISDLTTDIQAPASLTSSEIKTTSLKLTWVDKTSTETGFKVYKCVGSLCSDFQEIAVLPANTTTYVDQAVCENTIYRYFVKAYKTGDWESNPSNIIQVNTAPKGTFTIFNAQRLSENESSISFTFDGTDFDGFKVERCNSNTCNDSDYNVVKVLGTQSNTYSERLNADSYYTYRVKAYKNAACGWEVITTPITIYTEIYPPSELTLTAIDSTTLKLSWLDNTKFETSFDIERCEGTGCSDFNKIGSVNHNIKEYVDNSVCAGVTYNYRVRVAYNSFINNGGGCWKRRSKLNISNFVSNTAVRVNINYKNGMKSDFSDIRFLDNTSGIELPYWVESKVDNINATIWIKTGDNNDVYVYYDNPQASAPNFNAKDIFEFYEGFDGPSIDANIWYVNSSNYSISNGVLRLNTGSMRTKNPLQFNLSGGYILEGKITYYTENETYVYSGTLTGVSSPFTANSNSNSDATVLLMKNSSYSPYLNDLYYFIGDGSTTGYNQGSASLFRTSINTWYIFSEKYFNNGLIISRDYSDIFTKNFTWVKSPKYITIGEFSGGSSTNNIQDTGYDWIRIRKYFAAEPSVSIGIEEYTGNCLSINIAGAWEKVSNVVSGSSILPSNPSITATGVSEANIRVNIIDTNIDETGFRIYRCAGSGCNPKTDGTLIGTASANALNYLDTVMNGTYTYLVETFKDSICGWQKESNITSATTILPPPPSSLTASAINTTQVKLDWVDNTGSEDGFKIYRCIGNNCSDFTLLTTVASNVVTYTDNVCKAMTYKYKITAYKENSWETNYSNEVTAITSDITQPVLTLTRVSEVSVKLDWTDTSSDETGFKVERCDLNICNDSDFMLIATLGNNIVTYTDNVPITNIKYTYRVKVFKTTTCNWENVSIPKEITVSPNAPTSLSSTVVNTTTANLTWVDNTASETGFQIYRCEGFGCNPLPVSEGGSGVLVGISGPSSTNYQDITVCRSATYGYRVRAVSEGLSNGKGGCWTKRKLLTINNFQPHFQVKLIITYENGMQADFDDIRFYDATDNLELPYFVESKVDGVSAIVWFKTGRNNNIYMYYGNSNAVSSSNGYKVFEFFDDFEDGNYDGWSRGNSYYGSVSIVSDSPYGNYRVRNYHNYYCGYAFLTRTITLPAGKYVLNLKTRYDYSGNKCSTNNGIGYLLNFGNTCRFWYLMPNEDNSFCSTGQVNTGWSSTAQNTEISGEFVIPNYYSEDITSLTISARVLNSAYTLNLYTDNVSIRKYSTNEPTVNMGSEETNTCYAFAGWASNWSNTSYITTPTPSTPTLTASKITETQINLYWNDSNNDETGYEIWRCEGVGCDPKSGTLLTTMLANTSAYSDVNLNPMTTYRYIVSVYKTAVGCSGGKWIVNSNIVEVKTTITPPSSLTATAINTTQINLSWTDNSSTELGFKIYRCNGTNCSDYALIANVGTSVTTSYVDSSVCKNSSYRYKVTAYGLGWETDGGNEVTVTTPDITVPAQPNVQVIDHSKISVLWNDVYNDESGFKLKKCIGNSCEEINLPSNTNSYNDTGLNSYTEYCYSVKTYKNTSCSWETSYSTQVCARTLLVAPIILSVNAPASNKIIVSWLNPNPVVEGFEIEVELWNGKWVTAGRVFENYTSFIDKIGIQPKTTYRYRVKAFIGNTYSLPSAPVSVTTPSYSVSDYVCE